MDVNMKYGYGSVMKVFTLAIMLSICMVGTAQNEGSPFHTNYSADQYKAHERNFDVVCDKWGNVYFANFQGILHYDNTNWELLTTTDISRVTSLLMTDGGEVYVGGYNAIGKLVRNSSGSLEYKDLGVPPALSDIKVGEVKEIFNLNDTLTYLCEKSISFVVKDSVINRIATEGNSILDAFATKDKLFYQTEDYYIYECSTDGSVRLYSRFQHGDVMQICCATEYDDGKYLIGTNRGLWIFDPVSGTRNAVLNKELSKSVEITEIIRLSDGSWAISCDNGLYHLGKDLLTVSHYTEEKGLCCNAINALAADNSGTLWCAGVTGISAVSWPSFFSTFSTGEGLDGEVLCSERHEGRLFVGTYQGLFCYDAGISRFMQISDVHLACWNLNINDKNQLLASSSSGLYLISGAKAKLLSDSFCMSIIQTGTSEYLSGEVDGLYRISSLSPFIKEKIADVNQVDKIEYVSGTYWLENTFGEIFALDKKSGNVTQVSESMGLHFKQGNKLFIYNGKGYIVGRQGLLEYDDAHKAFVQSSLIDEFSYVDSNWWPGLVRDIWDEYFVVTSGDDKDITIYNILNGKEAIDMSSKIHALKDFPIRYVASDYDGILWAGGSFGLIRVDFSEEDLHHKTRQKVFFRQIQINDSIVWGGNFADTSYYSMQTLPSSPKFSSSQRNLTVDFGTLTVDSYAAGAKYSYFLEGYDEQWSDWSTEPSCDYKKLPYKKYILHVKSMDSFAHESDELSFAFSIAKPFYIKWYSIIIYVLVWIYLVSLFLKMRTAKMEREKDKLEQVVEERTSEVRKQRDEIHEKSKELEQTLGDLKQAQNDLVRQEKMAMVGKLTKGLVDRILNPINYINNFSMLTLGFSKDIKENMEDAKDQIPEEIYEDSMDLFDLMKTNLEKISTHGQSVSRILKSMEEMLRERNIVFTKLDICEQCRISLDVYKKQEAALLSQYGIKVEFSSQEESIVIDAVADLLKKAINSMIINAIYALAKKAEKEKYEPVLKITVSRSDADNVVISIRDNGIGIESKILPELFDPYFTTKPTAEAAGIGLYLTKDVIQTHNGTIEVKSEKGVYTEFIVKLPIKQISQNDER